MNVTAHRSMVKASSPPPDPVPPVEPDGPGPKPPPRILSARALTTLVSQLTTGHPHRDGPEVSPGPLDPYVRRALERFPQPLAPRSAFLAAVIMEFTERMTDVAELADLIPRPGGDAGHIIVAGHVARFVDEICGHGARMSWPFPWPGPPWFSDSLAEADLIVMGTQVQQCAAIALDRDLARTFADAAHALLEAGAARLS